MRMRTMSTEKPKFYFSTRDVFTLASLACMGAVASSLPAQAGASLRSFTGFPGGLQMFAGLHVVWLALAALIVPRPGSAAVAGLLKGSVEVLMGSPHGLFVLLIAAVAGLLIDLAVLLTPRRLRPIGLVTGAALAAGSNVVIFQAFARLPARRLVMAMLVGATVSGALLGGLPAVLLVRTLRRAGVIPPGRRDSPPSGSPSPQAGKSRPGSPRRPDS